MIQLKCFIFNPMAENTYLLYDESKEAIIIDPGCYEKHEQEKLKEFIQKNKLKVNKLLNTHCHIDHVLGNAFVKREFGVNLWIHEIEKPYLKAVSSYAFNYGFANYESTDADKFLVPGEKIHFGHSELDILFVPGHAPGHLAFYSAKDKMLIGGDVLFQSSIGRSDLPGGDFQTLINSIKDKFYTLPDDITVYTGHGPKTTIRIEKSTNPFVNQNT